MRKVRPVQLSTAALMFEVGRQVEVSFDAEDCRDAWFPATILDILRNGSFLVGYRSPIVGDEACLLKVIIDPLHVRPCPPLLKSKKFDLLEKIDASFDNGWWSGVITKELEDSRYLVFFKETSKNRKFHQSEIRPHMEWKDGKWITSSKDVLIPSSEDGKQGSRICTNGTAVAKPVRSSGNGKNNSKEKMETRMEQSTPHNQKPSPFTKQLTKSRHLSLFDSLDTLSQPLKNLKEGKAVAPSRTLHQQTILETSSKYVQDGSISPISGNTMTSSVKPPVPQDFSSNNPYWGRRIQRKQGKQKKPTSSSMKKRGRAQTPQVGKSELVEDVQEENVDGETDLGIILGLACTELGSSRHRTGSLRGKRALESHGKESLKLVCVQEQLSNDSAIQITKESKQSGTEVNFQKRKRGRPRRILINTLQTLVTGTTRKDVFEDEMVPKDCTANEVSHTSSGLEMSGMKGLVGNQESTTCTDHEDLFNGPLKQKHRSVNMMKTAFAEVPGEKVSGTLINPNKKNSSKRGKGCSGDQMIACQFQDASREKTMGSNVIVKEAKKVIVELPSNKLDDEPLCKWIEGTQAPTPAAFDGSEVISTRTAEQCIETGKKQNKIGPSEQHILPFEKNTIIWKTIESMEVFRRMPQNPHFQPLESYKESSREGLAVGFMVTFSSVVDKASRLQFNDPKSITDDILETLVDLERHGFDVLAVRDRIIGLGSVKERQEELMGQLEEINDQIFEHNLEINKADEEIGEINKQIRNLQEKLAVAGSTKETKNCEVASLQSKLLEIKESINNVNCLHLLWRTTHEIGYKGKMKKFAVKVEEGKEGRDGQPSIGPVYRNLLAEHAFPATDPALGTAWEMFR
ncbi:unnamed protein product [Fraxinus pennsylvanica]|uniref:Agenet domain-containing protein n=1 Tax=Fraxinus pennsylvanica TaxID=56036 RepID=A0AAD2E452_9LAMI|nr:unnamed protein product [Fraxinus pennsylvanica]